MLKGLDLKVDAVASFPPLDPAWLKAVAAMKADKQVEAVKAELMKRNPGFDGKLKEKIQGAVVTELEFLTDNVTDISPVRALQGLRLLACDSTHPKGQLADLSPLKGMQLTQFRCPNNKQVSDLSPLRDMKLVRLICYHTSVSDLAPLQDMKLVELNCGFSNVADLSSLKEMPLTALYIDRTPVSDLAALKEMKLTVLGCWGTKVADLAPLKGMPLTKLNCNVGQVTDLSPLQGTPLKEIWCDFKAERDAAILRSIKTLETINGKPVAEILKGAEANEAAFEAWLKAVAVMKANEQVEAVKAELMKRNPGYDGKMTLVYEGNTVTELLVWVDNVDDISPLRGLPGLRTLVCTGADKGKLADLSPLVGLEIGSRLLNDRRILLLEDFREDVRVEKARRHRSLGGTG